MGALTKMCQPMITRPSNSFTFDEKKNWLQSSARAMCDTKFSSDESFKSAAGKLGLSVPVASKAFGLDAKANYSQSELKQAYEKVCSQDQSFDSGEVESFVRSEQVTVDIAKTFNECVANLPSIFKSISPTGVVMTLSMSGEDVYEIDVKSFGQPLTEVRSVSGVTSCHIGDKEYTLGGPTVLLSPPDNGFSATCTRRSADNQVVRITTNEGITNAVTVAPKTSALTDLQQAVQSIKQEVSVVREQSAEARNALAAMQGQLAATSRAVSGIKLSCEPRTQNGNWAYCQPGETVASCVLGDDRGSYDIDQNQRSCRAHTPGTSWTRAICCKIGP
ncbi:hypothetical protein [Teichococcus vastitatis]|uniref:hypothetical protein n=1 Tax=Teichococcus vastitatis TaxID=2307076 RepID=UPI001F517B0C|nr:hypothetical protein [Pseudoroseomonas vastitatis]